MPRTVRAYHGTTYTAALAVLSGQSPFHPSTKPDDWLGHGIYFFEESLALAVDWAFGRVARNARQGLFDSPVVIAADIDLSHCLDLCSADHVANLRHIYQALPRPVRAQHAPILHTAAGHPVTVGDLPMSAAAWTFNSTDTTAIDALVRDLKQNGTPITSKRAAFVDGTQLYTNSYLFDRSQVQIAVLDQTVISNPQLLYPLPIGATNLPTP